MFLVEITEGQATNGGEYIVYATGILVQNPLYPLLRRVTKLNYLEVRLSSFIVSWCCPLVG